FRMTSLIRYERSFDSEDFGRAWIRLLEEDDMRGRFTWNEGEYSVSNKFLVEFKNGRRKVYRTHSPTNIFPNFIRMTSLIRYERSFDSEDFGRAWIRLLEEDDMRGRFTWNEGEYSVSNKFLVEFKNGRRKVYRTHSPTNI
ncbi:hypothetical protein PFISCL1PPCAC_11078, partial [Pristionchus fissidentatus]